MGTIPHLAIPPEQSDPLSQYGKMLSIQQLGTQQEIQKQQLSAAQLENQQRQLQVAQGQQDQQDQTNFRQAFKQANGDPDKTVALASQAGVGPKLLVPFQQSILDHKTKLLTYNKDEQDFVQKQADLMQGAHEQVAALPPEQRPGAYAQKLAALKSLGIDTSKMPPTYPGDDQFQLMGAVVNGHKQMLDDTFKQGEIAKNASAQQASDVETQLKQAQLNASQSGGVAPGVPLESQEATAFLKQNPGKTLTDFAQWKAKLNPIAQIQAANAAGGGLQQTAIDQAAERYASTGQLPPTARGAAGLAQSRQIMNRAAELHPEGNLAENSAEYAANKSSLVSLQKNFDQVSAFENTAGKNLDVFLKTAKPIVDSGSPWINKPLRAVATGALGSGDQAAFNAARQTAVTEIAKVLNSSNASGVLSDSARHEVEGLIGPDASMKQIYSAANILKQDMANRHQAYQEQIDNIKGRGVKPGSQNNTPPPATNPSGLGVSLSAAKALPVNKGKSDDEIRADIKAHGHSVIE